MKTKTVWNDYNYLTTCTSTVPGLDRPTVIAACQAKLTTVVKLNPN